MMQLAEQYRPRTWAEVVGQDKAVATVQRLIARGLGGRALWVSGGSGTGKSTIGKLAALELADEMNVAELDANECTPARLREIEQTCGTYGLGVKSGRAYLINEAHGLSKAAIRQLLVMLERIPRHVLWVFTTTSEGAEQLFEDSIDAGPLLSRCVEIRLTRQGLCKPFAAHLRAIAQREGLDGQAIERYERVMKDNGNNLRAGLQFVEAGGMVEER